jgi:hypothetical protein
MNEKNFRPGTQVRISSGSGLDSGKLGTIQGARLDYRSYRGNYKPVDWTREVPVMLADGTLITMFKNRLEIVSAPLPAREEAKRIGPKDLPPFDYVTLKPSYIKACGNPNLPADGRVKLLDIMDGVAFIETGNTLWKVPASAVK